jgi:hypothetical protein
MVSSAGLALTKRKGRQAGRHACMREEEEANEDSTVSTHPPPYTHLPAISC